MSAYKETLKEEVEVLRERGKKFLNDEITRADLKGFSGGLGSYSQREKGKFMVRLRTPSGIMTKEHLRLILDYIKDNGIDRAHLTTRQAVQLHELSIDQVCDVMKDAIDHDLFTRGGGGNFPRNVALSPMSGVAQGEAFDVTPYAVQVGKYFLFNATYYKLPRKLKVAFSSTEEDTACATLNDMGFVAVLDDGKPMFRLWLAGGLGGGPALGIPYDELVDPEEILYYIEAMVQLFQAEGDYKNKARARIRFIPRRMGVEAFLECYKSYVEKTKKECALNGIKPQLYTGEVWDEKSGSHVMIAQKQPGLYSVILHPLCGQLRLEDGEKLYDFVKDIEKAELRLSMDEEIYVRNLTKKQAQTLLEQMKGSMMMTPVTMSVSCIGTPTCQLGMNQSQALCEAIVSAVREAGVEDVLPRCFISGCPNSCSRHQVAPIGLTGRKVKVDGEMVDGFECWLGGRVGVGCTCMGEKAGTIQAVRIPKMLVGLGNMLKTKHLSFEQAMADNEAKADILAYIGQYAEA